MLDIEGDVLDNYDISELADDSSENNSKYIFQGFFFRNKELIGEKDLILDKSTVQELGIQNYSLIKFTNFNFQYASVNSTVAWMEVSNNKIRKVLLLAEDDLKRLQSTDCYVKYMENHINEIAARYHQKSDLEMDVEDYDCDEEDQFEWPEIEINSELEDYDEDGNYIFVS